MNFIDKALENNLHGDEFLQAMADIYSENNVRSVLDKYPHFIKDVITIIDYDTEIQMGGLDEIINGNMQEMFSQILQALENCGASKEASLLKKAKAMSPQEYEQKYNDLYNQLALNNDYSAFWDLVKKYIDDHLG